MSAVKAETKGLAAAASIGTCEGEGRVERWVAGGQVGVGVVSALVIVVLDVEAVELGVLDAQGAARVVDVLPVQRLQPQKTISPFVLPAEGFLFERLAAESEWASATERKRNRFALAQIMTHLHALAPENGKRTARGSLPAAFCAT